MPELNAAAIASAIILRIRDLGMNLDKLVGQGYDGASTMSGHVSGVQKGIRDEYPKAVYVHCAARCLNLVINDQSRVPVIRSACDVVRECIKFFRESPKRRTTLGVSIPLFCPTRWTAKYQSLRIFKNIFVKVLEALSLLGEDLNPETRGRAISLRSALERPGTTCAICVIARYAGLMEPLAQRLQSATLDVLTTKKLIADLEACEITGHNEMPIPRIASQQRFRENYPAENAEQFYRRSVFIPYLDGVIESLRKRFTNNETFFDILSILPPNEPTNIGQIEETFGLSNLQNEVYLWRSGCGVDLKKSVCQLYDESEWYLSVHNALRIILALPATTAEAERSFSTMKRVKTWLRSTMSTKQFVRSKRTQIQDQRSSYH